MPLSAVPLARLQRRERDGLHDRDRDVRRDRLHPALPAARLRRQPDELRAADAAADGRAARRRDRLGPHHQPRSAGTRSFPIAGTALLVVGMFLLSRLGVGTAPWLASVYMLVVGVGIGLVMQVLVLVVQNDARPRGHRRRDVDRDVLPLGRRLLRRRALRRDLRLAPRRPARQAPAGDHGASCGSGVHLNPEQAKHAAAGGPRRSSCTRSRTRSTASSSGGWRSR